MDVTAIIVAAGQGKRLGTALPKAFVPLAGKPLFAHSLAVLDSHPAVNRTVLAVPEANQEEARGLVEALQCAKPVVVTAGGSERWLSVANGVAAAPEESDWMLVHDAARPFVTHEVVDAILAATASYRAVITVTEVADTVRTVDGDRAGDTVDRDSLVRVGTPQLFRREDLLKGFELAPSLPQPPTDEAVLMQKLDIDVGTAPGDPMNFKVTSPEDLKLAELLLGAR
jgi:2-C-methyl-D-erythritol 4-phosphate cytidylyltransferase